MYLRAYLQWDFDRAILVETNAKRIILKGLFYTIGDDVVVNKDDDP